MNRGDSAIRPGAPIKAVLMATDAVGGVWTYTLDLAESLADRGIAVHVAVLGPPMSPDQRRTARSRRLAGLHEHPGKLEWMDSPWRDVDAATAWMLGLASDADVDVVHLGGYSYAAAEWPAPVVVVAHSCVLSWWRAVHHAEAPSDWDEYRRRVAGGLSAADAVVAPSAAMLAELNACYGAPDGMVIPNSRRAAPSAGRRKEPLILAAGRVWDPAKNLAALARAANELDWTVAIAGAGREPDHPRSACRMLGKLSFEELSHWQQRAAVFCAPSRYEPFGLAALEAAQAGCALVLGDIPSLREVWGDAAVYTDPEDADQLRRTLSDLTAHPSRVRAWGRRAAAHARRYRPEATAAAYLSVYGQARSRWAHKTLSRVEAQP
jgi:glycosyltransferase involved in cell wall biosynthesis